MFSLALPLAGGSSTGLLARAATFRCNNVLERGHPIAEPGGTPGRKRELDPIPVVVARGSHCSCETGARGGRIGPEHTDKPRRAVAMAVEWAERIAMQ